MKKRVKKLSLHRETLRHLQNVPLGMVVGGTNTSQECFQATGCECNTQDAGCTVPPPPPAASQPAAARAVDVEDRSLALSPESRTGRGGLHSTLPDPGEASVRRLLERSPQRL